MALAGRHGTSRWRGMSGVSEWVLVSSKLRFGSKAFLSLR